MLRIIRKDKYPIRDDRDYGQALQSLAIAEATIMKTNSKALDHFLAIVKEIERLYGFEFQTVEEK